MQKGITPVIAVILLLLITISMIGFTFVFFSRTTQTATQSGEQQLQQLVGQIGTQFKIEGVDKNKVYIRNLGTSSLQGNSLSFYVNNEKVNSDSPTIAPNTVGTVSLNDSQLAMLPDPAELRVTSAGFTDITTANFYGKYTVGYWKLDEGSGTAAADSSGNGNNGGLNPACPDCPSWVEGKSGKALSFDGTNDYVQTVKNIGIIGNSPRTLEFWVKVKSIPASGGVVIGWDGGSTNQRFDVVITAGGKWYLWGHGNDWDTGVSVVLNTWQHHVVTYDGTKIMWFIDGVELGSGSSNALNTGDSPLSIGKAYNYHGGVFSTYANIEIDEVRILSVARSMTIA